MKKLIPALCMLLVAACLMGTSTYAWFAANENVTATGMQVKAAADGGLAIGSWKLNAQNQPAAPVDGEFFTTAEAIYKFGNSTVKPTSLSSDGKWWTATSNENTDHTASVKPNSPEGTKPYSVVADTALAGYYQLTKWDVKSLDATANATYTLKVTGITVDVNEKTTAGSYLNKALRVAIKVENAWYVFAPLADATSMVDGKYYHANTADAPVAYADNELKLGTINATTGVTTYDVAIFNALDMDPTTLEVYVYYEGEDANCNTANIAADVDDLKVTISYSATKNP